MGAGFFHAHREISAQHYFLISKLPQRSTLSTVACCKKLGTELPRLGSQIKNFSFSIKNVIAHARESGQIVASKEKIAVRIATCESCPDKISNKCRVCGCYVVLKTGLDAESCPRGLW